MEVTDTQNLSISQKNMEETPSSGTDPELQTGNKMEENSNDTGGEVVSEPQESEISPEGKNEDNESPGTVTAENEIMETNSLQDDKEMSENVDRNEEDIVTAENEITDVKMLQDDKEISETVDKNKKDTEQDMNVTQDIEVGGDNSCTTNVEETVKSENIEPEMKKGVQEDSVDVEHIRMEDDLDDIRRTGSEGEMEEEGDIDVPPNQVNVNVKPVSGSFKSKKVVTIPSMYKSDAGDDLGIYDDPGECGEDLSDTEMEPRVNVASSYKQTNYKGKSPHTPILRNSGFKRGSRISKNSAKLDLELDLQDEVGSHVTWSAKDKHYTLSAADLRHMSGIRGNANTPASHITDFSLDSRNTSRVPSESREAMFRRAMSLLSARCTSVGPGIETPFGMSKQSSFGVQLPKYFYVRQERPSPMPPLKAWQGYHGNVYFEPLLISSVRDPPLKQEHPFDRTNELHRLLMTQQKQTERPESNNTGTLSRNTVKQNGSVKDNTRPSTRQMVLLDKRAVVTRQSTTVQNELDLIENYENTGSLNVRPKSDMTSDRPRVKKSEKSASAKKDRICRGSVVRHKLNLANRSLQQPEFKVNGGKYTSTVNTAPLLRTQTQYSLSNQRLTTNSPDLTNQQLPPLEQLRSAVRHMDSANKDKNNSYGQVHKPMSYSENLKPFIKYSPEIKAKKQAGFV